MKALYEKMKSIFGYHSDSLHRGDGRNISGIGLQEMEEIIQNTFQKYLEFCKTAFRNTPAVTEGNVKNNKINDLKSTIQLTTLADTLPA